MLSTRHATFLLILVLSAATTRAQQALPEPNCGFYHYSTADVERAVANTASADPGLYARMAEPKRETALAAAVGTQHTFFVLDRDLGRFTEVPATLAFDGRLARIWIDNRDTARLSPGSATIGAIARALDTATSSKSRNPALGILENDAEVFGAIPQKYAVEGKSDFFLTDIADAGVVGYFFPYDQTDEAGSNRRNLLYIDSREGASRLESLLNTIGHEFQHLIHRSRNPNSETVFDEGCAEEAGRLCGYIDRSNVSYLRNTNVDLFAWNTGSINADYERAYTLVHYLREQFGEGFLHELVGTTGTGMNRINAALAGIGIDVKSSNWLTVMRGFAVANYLQTSAVPEYGYQTKITTSLQMRARLAATWSDLVIPTSSSVQLARYGIEYYELNSPSVLTFTYTSPNNATVMATAYRGTQVDVIDITKGIPHTFRTALGTYDRIVLAFINLSGSAQTVTWTTSQRTTVGIEEEKATGTDLAVTGIAPNPAVESARVRFVSPGGTARLELFDATGSRVRTLAEGSWDAGVHEVAVDCAGLEAGYYVVRLTQNGTSRTRPLLIAR